MKKIEEYSAEAYFALPLCKREKYGIYQKPAYLISGDWAIFEKRIREEYPIQGWLREWAFTYHNPVYATIIRGYWALREFNWAIRRFIKPVFPRYRKVSPRWKYIDGCELIPNTLFAIVLDFWHIEVKASNSIEWGFHKEFYTWLKECVAFIEVDSVKMQNEIDALYKTVDYDNKKQRVSVYKKIDRIEARLEKTKSMHLKKIIEYRGLFWT